jgi:hypothetical protein
MSHALPLSPDQIKWRYELQAAGARQNDEQHEHEHDGPGTIRNHPRDSRHFELAKARAVILEALTADWDEAVADPLPPELREETRWWRVVRDVLSPGPGDIWSESSDEAEQRDALGTAPYPARLERLYRCTEIEWRSQ